MDLLKLLSLKGFKPYLPFKMKKDRGVAGLTVLLSVIALLFVIGFLVMIFALMGGSLEQAVATSNSGSVTNETITPTDAGVNTANAGLRDASCTVTAMQNATNGPIITSGNYTMSGCTLTNLTSEFTVDAWNVSYTYSWTGNTEAGDTINETTSAIAETTSWFAIIVTISVMVVLILLTIIIINAIRGSGLLSSGTP